MFVVVSGDVSGGASQLSCGLVLGCPSSEMSILVLVTVMEAVAVEWLSFLDLWLRLLCLLCLLRRLRMRLRLELLLLLLLLLLLPLLLEGERDLRFLVRLRGFCVDS